MLARNGFCGFSKALENGHIVCFSSENCSAIAEEVSSTETEPLLPDTNFSDGMASLPGEDSSNWSSLSEIGDQVDDLNDLESCDNSSHGFLGRGSIVLSMSYRPIF